MTIPSQYITGAAAERFIVNHGLSNHLVPRQGCDGRSVIFTDNEFWYIVTVGHNNVRRVRRVLAKEGEVGLVAAMVAEGIDVQSLTISDCRRDIIQN